MFTTWLWFWIAFSVLLGFTLYIFTDGFKDWKLASVVMLLAVCVIVCGAMGLKLAVYYYAHPLGVFAH